MVLRFKFHKWIDFNKINWSLLSENVNALDILVANLDKVYWHMLSRNLHAIHILEKNITPFSLKNGTVF